MRTKLYPVDYVEPEAAAKDNSARDTAAALAIIRAAVPKGGEPLERAQLVALVCGRYVRSAGGSFLSMDGAPDASKDIAAARTAALAGAPLKGPAACASLTHEEVSALVDTVIAERKASWKLIEAAVPEIAIDIEVIE